DDVPVAVVSEWRQRRGRRMGEADAGGVVVDVVLLRADVLRDRDLEARRAMMELVLENPDVLGGLDPEGAVFGAVRDVLLDQSVRGEGRPDAVLEVVDRLVLLDRE